MAVADYNCNCDACGDHLYIPQKYLDGGAKAFCSKECFDAYKESHPEIVETWLALYWHARRLWFEDNRVL
jgi:hypothetical protein